MREMSEAQIREVEELRGKIARLRAGNKRVRWPEDIRRRVGALRKAMRGSELAAALGVPAAMLYGWSQGNGRPDPDDAPRVLRVTPADASKGAVQASPLVISMGGMRISITVGP